jgi:hypothetical protein
VAGSGELHSTVAGVETELDESDLLDHWQSLWLVQREEKEKLLSLLLSPVIVALFCRNFLLTFYKASPSGYTASSYLWSIALGNGESLSLGNEFSFWLIDGGYDVQVYSPQFYLDDPTASSTTASSSTTSTSSSSSSAQTTSSQSSSMPVSTTASPPTGSTATPTTTPSPAADTSSGFSTGAIVGVAVGVIATFGLGLGLAYFLF